jgi:chemotaxis protein methyltransferase CheR
MQLSEQDVEYLRRLVHSQSSNVVDVSRSSLFETYLAPLVGQSGAASLGEFVEILRNQTPGPMHHMVAERMTVNETSFFRDIRSFDLLHNEILPRLIDHQRHKRSLYIWSGACATGQEPYSLAILLEDSFPDVVRSWDVRIISTDYSAAMVKYAQAGRYKRIEVNRGLSAKLLVKYFVQHGDDWDISQKLRHICEFHQVNLCAPMPPMPMFDLVLLRNVLIYFTAEDRTNLLRNIRNKMASHSCLMLGNAEQANGAEDLFEPAFSGSTFYYRPIRRAA